MGDYVTINISDRRQQSNSLIVCLFSGLFLYSLLSMRIYNFFITLEI